MPAASSAPDLLGRSPVLRPVRAFIERAARVDASVLLEGETGTGKGLVARLLHARSRRASGPFVALNCAGIPESLFESELFGHARGAFTGADRDRQGLLAAADGGTLLLDEIGELPPAQQAKLLVAVEERSVRPVGATAERSIDLRLVSATCRTLADELDAGRFRPDLYHRVALLRLTLPPLRDRPEDILPLARRFLARAIPRHGTGERAFAADAHTLLREHPWPGNVRELAHAVEAAAILADGVMIDAALLGRILERRGEERGATGP